jgi:hypothetical protein
LAPKEPDVTGRLLLGGVAWLAAIVLFAAALQWSAHGQRLSFSTPASAFARLLNVDNEGRRLPSWAVITATGAHHVLVVEVEADDASAALVIAPQIVARVQDRYQEVLIYVRQQRASDRYAAHRVQWTPGSGYHELVIH